MINLDHLICPVVVTDLTPARVRDREHHALYLSQSERDRVLHALGMGDQPPQDISLTHCGESVPLRLWENTIDDELEEPNDPTVPAVSGLESMIFGLTPAPGMARGYLNSSLGCLQHAQIPNFPSGQLRASPSAVAAGRAKVAVLWLHSF